nr:TolC family protein [uncultured Desulfuromonas sp.]
MRNKPFIVTFLILITALPSLAMAWTVSDLQKSAASQRYLVREYQAAMNEQQQVVRSRRGEFMPSLDLFYQAQNLRDETQWEPEKYHSRGIQLTWNLFNGFGDHYRLLSQKQQHQVAQWQLKEIQQTVQEQVAQTCLLIKQQLQNLEVARHAVQLYEQERHNAQAKFDVGLLTRNDVLKIEVELENARLDVNTAETTIRQQIAQLQRQTLASVDLDSLNLDELAELPQLGEQQALQEQLLTSNRELLALRHVIESANLSHKASRDRYLPRADLVSEFSRSEDDYFINEGDNRDEQVTTQLQLSLNLFDGFKDDASRKQAQLAADRASYNYHEREHELTTELDNLRRDFLLAHNNLKVAQTNSEQARENLRITRLSFDQGLTTSAELLDAIFYQTRADLNIIEARTAIFSAYFTIQHLIGAFQDITIQ